MATLYLELYQQSIPDGFSDLPGFDNYQAAENIYWAVLTRTPAAGSEEAVLLQPFELTSFPNVSTHGTDTLLESSDSFVLVSCCTWHPKQPPYAFRITFPDGTEQSLEPSIDSDDEHAWFCQAVQSSAAPYGIYVIEVIRLQAPSFPQSFDGSNAMLNSELLPFSSDFFEKQPLLRVTGFEQNIVPQCPELKSVDVKGCAPGDVEFLLGFDQFVGIDQLVWTFGEGTTAIITFAEQSSDITVDNLVVDGPGQLTASQIEITAGAAFVIKVQFEYLEQANTPPDYINGSVLISRSDCPAGVQLTPFQVDICEGTAQPPCPNINGPEVQFPEDCESGKRRVTFTGSIASDYYGGAFRLVDSGSGQNIDEDEMEQGAQINDAGELELSAEIELAAGNYEIFIENDCSSSSSEFTVECPECPEINFLLTTSGRDCVNGLRPMNFNVEVKSPDKGAELEAQLIDEESGAVLATAGSSNGYLVFSASNPYPEGEHSVRVVIVEPPGCDDYSDDSDRLRFLVAGCPDEDCPDIGIGDIETRIDTGCTNGQRNVSIEAEVSVPAGFDGSFDANLSDQNETLASVTGASETTSLSANRSYPPGEQTLSVDVTTDEGCSYSRSRTISVDSCEPPPWRPPNWIPPVPDWLCLVWLVINFLLLLVTAVAIGVAACFWQEVTVLIVAATIAVVVGIIAILSWIAWVLLCGWKPNVCPFARWLPRILVIIGFICAAIVLVVAIIEAIVLLVVTSEAGGAGALASLPCFLGAFIEFAYFGTVAFIVWELLLIVGCEPLPLVRLPRLPDLPEQ